jgi:4-hydroxyphenylpyruvate dioxygenase-like putative hemolysin
MDKGSRRSQAVGRIDHISIVVYPENIYKYVDQMSRVFGMEFEPAVVLDDRNVILCMSLIAGIQFVAPIRPEGKNWEKLQNRGEGAMTVVLGVDDLNAAIERAKSNGAEVKYEIELPFSVPWRNKFDTFREAALGDMCTLSLAIGQIEPKPNSGSPD